MSKTCFTCKQEKPLSEFYKNGNNIGGYDGSCRICKRQYAKDYIERIGRAKIQEHARHSRYGIKENEFQAILQNQQNSCAICAVQFTQSVRPYVDHDHKTGKVRGLLCRQCNLGLGHFQDNLWFVSCARDYLKSFEELWQNYSLKELYIDEMAQSDLEGNPE